MLTQGSNQEEIECWGEPSSRPLLGLDLSEWMRDEEGCSDLLRPRWSLGIRRKEDLEEKSTGMTFTHGSHKCHHWEQRMELEELEEKEERMGGEHGQANWTMDEVGGFQKPQGAQSPCFPAR